MKTKHLKHRLVCLDLARVGSDDVGALRLTEGAKASIRVLGSDRKMVGGALLELIQRAGDGQRTGLHLAHLHPALLRWAARFSLKCESRFFSLGIEIYDSLTILHTVSCQ